MIQRLFKSSYQLRLLKHGLPTIVSQRSKSVRVGCASGFFGDTSTSAKQLVSKGNIDYLVMDYLSEITMSLLVGAQKKDPSLGWIPDFVQQAQALKLAVSKGMKVIANAGGINPQGCADALSSVLNDEKIKIAVVTGDNVLTQAAANRANIKEMRTGLSLPESTNSATAYLGAGPIVTALEHGADIIITGRCTDSALALAPLMFNHQWETTDLDLLAAGSLAGHLIECGAQSTGGVFTDWQQVSGWDDIGFPIIDCNSDGSFILTKPPNTGGLVTPATVKEQLLYEIHDPASYILPDVTCDFTQVKIEPTGEQDEVLVTEARGRPAPHDYKVCATYHDGYRLTAVATITGPKAAEKGEKTAQAILSRVNRVAKTMKMEPITDYHLQILGSEGSYGPQANPLIREVNREGVMWFAARHTDKRVLGFLSKEIAPAGTGMAPGLTGIVGGRPKVSPVFKLFSFLHSKTDLTAEISVNGEVVDSYKPAKSDQTFYSESQPEAVQLPQDCDKRDLTTVKLSDVVHTRSGDKGDDCNIGVISRSPDMFPYLVKYLTEDKIAQYFSHVFDGETKVDRFVLPGVHALNFVLRSSLGGGGIASLRPDPQGKAYGQMLLDLKIQLPKKAVSSSIRQLT